MSTKFLQSICLTIVIVFICLVELLATGCQNNIPISNPKNRLADEYPRNCVNIHGTVSGDITANSRVFLYSTSTTLYDAVMDEIGEKTPIKSASINQSGEFNIGCIPPGEFAFVIPTNAYRGSIGSPLPYEFVCDNLSLRIAFQGGNAH